MKWNKTYEGRIFSCLILTAILIAAGILVLSSGCAQKSENSYHQKTGLSHSLVYITDEPNEINSIMQFEAKLKDFYSFTQEFFAVWDYHIEKTDLVLEKFNNSDTGLNEKIKYSQILLEKYRIFKQDLSHIDPPSEASRAYKFALEAINQRILFFEGFQEGRPLYVLDEAEQEAYLMEKLFWEEINKIYDHLDQAAVELGINKDNGLGWI